MTDLAPSENLSIDETVGVEGVVGVLGVGAEGIAGVLGAEFETKNC